MSDEDGTPYGLTRSLLNARSEPGDYPGWGYINFSRMIVFRFTEGARDEVPADWVVVWSEGLYVGVPRALHEEAFVQDGAWVAFRAKKWSSPETGREKLTATGLFPLDVQHPRLILQLVVNGKVDGKEHAELLGQLLNDVVAEGSQLQARVCTGWSEALELVADLEGLPAEQRRLARVVRTRLSSSGAKATAERRTPPKQQKKRTRTERGERQVEWKPPVLRVQLDLD